MCWSSPGCIEELFISCQEIKNNCHLQFFCVYLLLPPFLSLRHTHTHIFNLPIHYNPLWNRISCLLCLVQQAYTYFSLSQDAAEPSNAGCHPTRLTHSLTHATKQTQGQISPCLVLCAALQLHSTHPNLSASDLHLNTKGQGKILGNIKWCTEKWSSSHLDWQIHLAQLKSWSVSSLNTSACHLTLSWTSCINRGGT